MREGRIPRSSITILILLGVLLVPRAGRADPVVYDLELKATFNANDSHYGYGNIFAADGNGNGWLEIYHYAYIDGYGWATTIEEVSPDFQVTEHYRMPLILPWEVGDADSDGLIDLIISTEYSTFSLMEALAPGALPTVPVFSAGWYGTYVSYAVTMDLDQDGFKEVVTNSNDWTNTLHVFECDGDNSFAYLGILPLHANTHGHVSGDFDGDGQMELVVGDGRGYVTVFEHHGGILPEMTWQERVNPDGSYCASAVVVDLEMDGTDQVAFMCYDYSAGSHCIVRLLQCTGNDDYVVIDIGTLGTHTSRPWLSAGHVTGHLWPGILQCHQYADVWDFYLWSHNDQAEYEQSGLVLMPMGFATERARGFPVADFDFDGRDEIIWATEGEFSSMPGAIFSVDYSDDLSPPVTDPIDPPTDQGWPPLARIQLSGTATDDFSGIRSVEASTDLGATWRLVSAFPDWSMGLHAPLSGRIEVALRSTDCSGKVEDPPAYWSGYVLTPTPGPTQPPTPTSEATQTPTPVRSATPTSTASPAPTETPTPTPLPLAVFLILPETHFSPGNIFCLDAELTNPDLGFQAPLAVLLDVYGAYWFWPSWCEYPPDWDYQLIMVHQGLQTLSIIDPFPWPDTGTETLTGIWFHAALLDETVTAILGESDSVEWGYGP